MAIHGARALHLFQSLWLNRFFYEKGKLSPWLKSPTRITKLVMAFSLVHLLKSKSLPTIKASSFEDFWKFGTIFLARDEILKHRGQLFVGSLALSRVALWVGDFCEWVTSWTFIEQDSVPRILGMKSQMGLP